MALSVHHTLAVYIVLITLSVTTSAPSRTVSQEDFRLSLDKRPKYMDTRKDLDILRAMILLGIQKQMNDDGPEQIVVPEGESPEPLEKRERYMGICMRKQSNSFIPFPCLRNGR